MTKNTLLTKNNVGEGRIYLAYISRPQSGLLTGSLVDYAYLSLLYSPGPPAQEMVPLIMYWALLHQSRQSLIEMSTDQLDKDNYSVETTFHQVIVGYFKLAVNSD